jgi:hypothetical protein
VNGAASRVDRVVVGVVASTTVPTVTQSVPGANVSGGPSYRSLFVIFSTLLDKARMFAV